MAEPATAKMDPGEIDVAIMCGGVLIRPGDFVAGDDEGVVVLSREIASEVVNLAEGSALAGPAGAR